MSTFRLYFSTHTPEKFFSIPSCAGKQSDFFFYVFLLKKRFLWQAWLQKILYQWISMRLNMQHMHTYKHLWWRRNIFCLFCCYDMNLVYNDHGMSQSHTYSLPAHNLSILSVESQKGVNAVQWCSIENQKGAIAVQRLKMLAPFLFSMDHC